MLERRVTCLLGAVSWGCPKDAYVWFGVLNSDRRSGRVLWGILAGWWSHPLAMHSAPFSAPCPSVFLRSASPCLQVTRRAQMGDAPSVPSVTV